MASSYTTSFGIEKIGSGEQSGAWGDTTNHNIDILDRIASYKAVALSGSTHTLTVREASPGSGTENLQDGMYRVIKFTGALGANNTVTVAPNTTAAFFIMINATTDSGSSGPYSVILTQGSGANITIANGKSAIVYMDGAGSGAAVIDAISNLQLATITASGDITSAGTVNVTGDTAAGDDASIGFTAAEGLILTGQGSTNDVTIKNDADADVLEIPTGTTNVTVVGNFTASGNIATNGSQSQWSKGADVASGSALPVLTDGNYFDVTGTTTITSINTTGGAGTVIKLHFDGACQITHHATNLVLAGAQNFTTEAGDELEFVEYDTGKYRQTGWCLAGTKPGGGGGGAFLGEGASGASVGNSGDIIRVNEHTLNTSQTMVATDNGSCTGPFSIASGVTLTISSGATFVVI
tara:strand:- start:271 stop:1500 length:1230 start_codon:yes stop_codon:yes gene_type:complete